MKIPDNSIILTNSEYRPCFVVPLYSMGEVSRALFHKWVTQQGTLPTGDLYTETGALVEFEDGTVKIVDPGEIKFRDTEGLFKQFIWGDEKETT